MKFTYPSGAKPLQGYTIKRGIGIGGFGEVYFALNDAGKEVALKKIQRNMDIELRGVRQCLNIRHVNLIALWDIRTSQSNESWVVMEYVPGPSLRDLLDDHPRGIPESMLKLWFTSIASGVAYLHHRGIVHRDLKPGNVFRDDDAHVIKIGDYGLSKFISSNQQPGQTGTVGTVHYMAPEVSKGIYGKEIDVYALGIMLYELLTGDVPFDGETSQEIMYKHLLETADLNQTPAAYRKVLEGSLTKEPESRFSNVAEMMAAMPWPEFAGKNRKVLSLHSVGVFPRPDEESAATGSANRVGEQASTGARIEPILISNANQGAHVPEIVIGALSDYAPNDANAYADADERTRQLRKTTPPRDSQNDIEPPEDASGDRSRAPKRLAKRTTVVGMDPAVLIDPASVEAALAEMPSGQNPLVREPKKKKGKLVRLSQRRRILAKKVARKCHAASTKFSNHALATPVRIVALLAIAITISLQPQSLAGLVLLLAIVCVSWFMMRTWAGASEIEREQKLARKTGVEPAFIRSWIQRQPLADRATEGLGSVLVAAMICVVACLSGLCVWESWSAAPSVSLQGLAFYAWLTLTSFVGSSCITCISKKWEASATEQILTRRLSMAAAGPVVGLLSVSLASYFQIDLGFEKLKRFSLVDFELLKLSKAFEWILFFTSLFAAFRWWKFCDLLRRSRVSVWDVGICLVVAATIGTVLGLPLIPVCVVSFVMAVASQLASPWLNQKQRELMSPSQGRG